MSLEALRDYFLSRNRIPSRHLLRRLEQDPRRGARRIAAQALERRREAEREAQRLRRLIQAERDFWSQGIEHVAGVDEVGVGPLAGPLVAAAVVFPPGTSSIPRLRDSKELSGPEREEIAVLIRDTASCVGIGEADVREIDELNPYHAALLAMRRAVQRLLPPAQQLLVDARTIPDLEVPQKAVIKGDQKHFSIAAASVIAKTWRDGLMVEMDGEFPGYGFASHKGYSTPEHQAAIRKLGPCPQHRLSYPFVQELAGNCSDSFYRLKGLLAELETRDDLRSLLREIRRSSDLSEIELKKLKVLIYRRTKHWRRPAQLRLL